MRRSEAKYWLEPAIELAQNHGFNERQLRSVKALIEAHANDIRDAWARAISACCAVGHVTSRSTLTPRRRRSRAVRPVSGNIVR
jgi:hypothetical protein